MTRPRSRSLGALGIQHAAVARRGDVISQPPCPPVTTAVSDPTDAPKVLDDTNLETDGHGWAGSSTVVLRPRRPGSQRTTAGLRRSVIARAGRAPASVPTTSAREHRSSRSVQL